MSFVTFGERKKDEWFKGTVVFTDTMNPMDEEVIFRVSGAGVERKVGDKWKWVWTHGEWTTNRHFRKGRSKGDVYQNMLPEVLDKIEEGVEWIGKGSLTMHDNRWWITWQRD